MIIRSLCSSNWFVWVLWLQVTRVLRVVDMTALQSCVEPRILHQRPIQMSAIHFPEAFLQRKILQKTFHLSIEHSASSWFPLPKIPGISRMPAFHYWHPPGWQTPTKVGHSSFLNQWCSCWLSLFSMDPLVWLILFIEDLFHGRMFHPPKNQLTIAWLQKKWKQPQVLFRLLQLWSFITWLKIIHFMDLIILYIHKK